MQSVRKQQRGLQRVLQLPLPPPPLENAEPVAAEGLALKDVVRICSDHYGVASCAAEGQIVEFLKDGSEVAIRQVNFVKRVAEVKDVRLVSAGAESDESAQCRHAWLVERG